jgi:cephalosporin-C deacetylase
VHVHDVRFSGYGGEPVAGWFRTPADVARPLPCVVQFIGYGGGRGRPREWLLLPAAGYAVLVLGRRSDRIRLVRSWRGGATRYRPHPAERHR